MLNKFQTKVENGIVYHSTIGVDTWEELGPLKDVIIRDNYLCVDGDSIPLDSLDMLEMEVISEWNKLYPNGNVMSLESKRLALILKLPAYRYELQNFFIYDGYLQRRHDYDIQRMQTCQLFLEKKLTTSVEWDCTINSIEVSDYLKERVTKNITDPKYFEMMIIYGAIHESFLRGVEKQIIPIINLLNEDSIDSFNMEAVFSQVISIAKTNIINEILSKPNNIYIKTELEVLQVYHLMEIKAMLDATANNTESVIEDIITPEEVVVETPVEETPQGE